jgi:hypothetical protein
MRCWRTKKIRYATESDARLMANCTPALHPRNHNVTSLRGYSCQFCGDYHLTHQPLREKSR